MGKRNLFNLRNSTGALLEVYNWIIIYLGYSLPDALNY